MPNPEGKETTHRYGTVGFERRRYPRFGLDLPIEYAKSDLVVKNGRAINASEGGLLLYLPEKIEIGQHLKIGVFFSLGSELKTIETEVEVVWMDIHLEEDLGDYRTGVKFVDILPADLESLRNLLRSSL
jgi:c-di-GMP-binding flagellar brake protein YcgR